MQAALFPEPPKPKPRRKLARGVVHVPDVGQLRADLAECAKLKAALAPEFGRLEAAFVSADRRLAQTPLDAGKEWRLKLYDARMAAGVAWFPVRQKLRELDRWKKAIELEFTCLKAEGLA